MVSIGSDHAGFDMKEIIKKNLKLNGIEFKDLGTYNKESVDYPLFAQSVSISVASGESEKGILVCGTGIGVSIVANKVKSIRAALCNSEIEAELARKHNNANVLCLGGRMISDELALKIIDTFLKTEFEGGRHEKRVEQISKIEQQI